MRSNGKKRNIGISLQNIELSAQTSVKSAHLKPFVTVSDTYGSDFDAFGKQSKMTKIFIFKDNVIRVRDIDRNGLEYPK